MLVWFFFFSSEMRSGLGAKGSSPRWAFEFKNGRSWPCRLTHDLGALDGSKEDVARSSKKWTLRHAAHLKISFGID